MRKFLFFILALFSLSTFAQKASAELADKEIRIGEQTTIDLELRFNASSKAVIMPALKDTISEFIEIVALSNIDTTFDEEDITTKIFHQEVIVTSWDSGFHAIPPFIFTVDGDTVKTEPLLLSVKTIPVEEQADIKDIKEPLEVPFSLTDWLLAHKMQVGLALLAIILIIIGIVLYRRYKNRPQTEEEVFVPKEAADVVAFRKLNELKDKKLWQNGKVKDYYVNLSFIVREYISNRYQMHALEHTTDEIMALANQSLDLEEGLKKKLHQMLMLADMAKFAKQEPMASENEEAFKHAMLFIEETKINSSITETDKAEEKEDKS